MGNWLKHTILVPLVLLGNDSAADIIGACIVPDILGTEISDVKQPVPTRDAFQFVKIPETMNNEQASLLKYAYDIAKADGHTNPSILQGLIWQESKAGGLRGYEVAGDEYGLGVGQRYYGIGQIKVSAARDVFRRFSEEFAKYKGMASEEIIAHLIMDQEFNIRVASKYLWMMRHNETKSPVFVRPVNYAITAYNRGLGNTYDTDYNNWHYTISVHKHKDTFIKQFNLANNIAK